MKKKDLYVAIQSLDGVKDLKSAKFAYALLKNKKKIEEEIKILEEVIKPSQGFESYEMERVKLCEIHCEKNESGEPIIENNRYKIIKEDLFNVDLEDLKNKYNDSIIERTNQIEQYNKLLEEEINLELTKIGFNDIPENISAQQLESIEFMINIY